MNSKQFFFKSTQFLAKTAILIAIVIGLSAVTFAKGNNYQLNKVAQLNHDQNTSSDWQQLIINPANTQQYFIIKRTGQMLLADSDMNPPHLLLDLSIQHPKDSSFVKLTAVELHPNFSLRDQDGYGTFYTAHIETLNKSSKTKRIQEQNAEIELKFDAVITQWQFNSSTYKKVDLKTSREVIRIAVPDSNMNIKQMSFNPYTKSWNEGFGLLYIAVNGQEKWQKALYSGVVLRINPAKFGLRSFTVPNDNPYLKVNEIKDEIFLLGAQEIKQFIWPDKNSEDLLLSHHYKNQSLLSLTGTLNDWRESAPKKIIYQSDNSIADVLMYRGRSLPLLRNKLLLLTKENQSWLINSLNIKPPFNKSVNPANKVKQEWLFTEQQLTSDSELKFSLDRDGEILLLDKIGGVASHLIQENLGMESLEENRVVSNDIQPESTNNSYFFYIILIAIGVVLYWLKRNGFSAKSIVRKQFAHIELSESKLQIGLYHRHQRTTDTIIDLADIKSCEVKLNEHTINLISEQPGHGFNHDKEQDLRNIFAKEQVDKMIDGKIRQVSLCFNDTKERSYTVCLYMRKGSDRITKKTYSIVIDDIIDWCWLIAEIINFDETEKRQKPITPPVSIVEIDEQSKNEVPLHAQAAVIRPATHQAITPTQNTEADLPQEQLKVVEVNVNAESDEVVGQSKTIDTDLVNALEKLVNLKQQGFLTQEEFIKAKENLMQGLFDK